MQWIIYQNRPFLHSTINCHHVPHSSLLYLSIWLWQIPLFLPLVFFLFHAINVTFLKLKSYKVKYPLKGIQKLFVIFQWVWHILLLRLTSHNFLVNEFQNECEEGATNQELQNHWTLNKGNKQFSSQRYQKEISLAIFLSLAEWHRVLTFNLQSCKTINFCVLRN